MSEEKTIKEKMNEYENLILKHDEAVLEIREVDSKFNTSCSEYVGGKDISHDTIISLLNVKKQKSNEHTALLVRKNLLEQELSTRLGVASGTMPIVAYIHKALNNLSQ